MDIGSAFTFMFDDEEWVKKLAIGGGIALVATILSPILVGIVLFLPLGGYMLETLKGVRDGQTKLPEWSDFGNLFVKGLMLAVIGLVYNIPVILLVCLAAGVNIGMAEADADLAQALGILSACFTCLQIVLSILISFILPGAIIRYAQYDTFGSAFQIGEIFRFITGNIGNYIIAFLLLWVASMLSLLGLIVCIIGVFFTMFWAILVQGNLYGQLARQTT
jgi:hypothetical protein